jgi:hypothetical protein
MSISNVPNNLNSSGDSKIAVSEPTVITSPTKSEAQPNPKSTFKNKNSSASAEELTALHAEYELKQLCKIAEKSHNKKNIQALENNLGKIENATAGAALGEIVASSISATAEACHQGKFNPLDMPADTIMYGLNSVMEYFTNAKLSPKVQGNLVNIAGKLGLKEATTQSNKQAYFAENKDKVFATILKSGSMLNAGFSALGLLIPNKKHEAGDNKLLEAFKLVGKNALALPSLLMFLTYSGKISNANKLKKLDPKNVDAKAATMTGFEDLICGLEALALISRQTLCAAFPDLSKPLKAASGMLFSGLSYVNANNSLKESESEEDSNLSKNKFLHEKLPEMIYPTVNKIAGLCGINLAETEKFDLKKVTEQITNGFKLNLN